MKLLNVLVLSLTMLLFSACGGGGGSDAHFKNGDNTITIIDCNATVATIPDDYTTMLSGDVLVNETANTSVTTYHDINGTKKVCTVSRVAHLIR